MKYRISEVSKIVNIPVDTIRYYVKRGFITPQKEGSYHYYDAWDINYLLEYKKYRRLELSMKDIMAIFVEDSLNSFSQRFIDLKHYYIRQEKYYRVLSEKVSNQVDTLMMIPESLEKFEITERPEMYYFNHRQNYEYENANELTEESLKWIDDYLALVDGIVVFEKGNLLSQDPKNDYTWGFAMQTCYLNELGIPVPTDCYYLEPCRSIHTILCAGDKGTFNVELLKPVIDFVKHQHYTINGDIVGNLLARVHEEGVFRRYLEFWIPIV